MSQFTLETIKNIKSEAQSVLQEIAKKYNVEIRLTNTTYTTDHFTTKMEVKNLDKQVLESKTLQTNKFLKTLYGAKFEIGFEFDQNGKHFTVVDLNTRSRKTPIVISDQTGVQYKAPVDFVNKYVLDNPTPSQHKSKSK